MTEQDCTPTEQHAAEALAAVAVDVDEPVAAPDPFAEWPAKGGPSDRQPWRENSIRIAHSRPTLSSGSADPAVVELAGQLHDLGYESSISQGENPFHLVDGSVLAAVRQFRRDYGVQEDPTGFGGDNDHGRAVADNHIGPWTWEAIARAHARLED